MENLYIYIINVLKVGVERVDVEVFPHEQNRLSRFYYRREYHLKNLRQNDKEKDGRH